MGFRDRLGLGDGGGAGGPDDADVARIEAGGIPRHAEQRLRELAAGGTAFTSDLSVAGYALARLDGVRPISQVMGSSVYQVGWQSYPWGSVGGSAAATELRSLTDAWNDARARALSRLSQEAALAGAHAVVGVTFDANRHAFLSGEIEVVVRGTAVALPEGGDEPLLSDLSLPEYTLLRRAGYSPAGVVTATSVWYVLPSWSTQRLTSGWQRFQPNQELPEFTQGVYHARAMAIGRATADARDLGAHGLVGVRIEQEVHPREVERNDQKRLDLIVTFHVVGTAIRELGAHRPLDVRTVVRQGARP